MREGSPGEIRNCPVAETVDSQIILDISHSHQPFERMEIGYGGRACVKRHPLKFIVFFITGEAMQNGIKCELASVRLVTLLNSKTNLALFLEDVCPACH